MRIASGDPPPSLKHVLHAGCGSLALQLKQSHQMFLMMVSVGVTEKHSASSFVHLMPWICVHVFPVRGLSASEKILDRDRMPVALEKMEKIPLFGAVAAILPFVGISYRKGSA